MQQEVFLGLKKIPLLTHLPDDALNALAISAKEVKFAKQSVIISEGDHGNSLYIILSGKVRVYSSDDKSKEVTLITQEAGSYFGELALLGDEPRSASIEALEKTVCATITKSEFTEWLMNYPEVAIGLLSDLSGKIRYLTDKVKQLALSNVYERTVKVLQEMAVKKGDYWVIERKPTQQELANIVGSSREMVNKVMKELTKGDYIEIKDKHLIIKSKPPSYW